MTARPEKKGFLKLFDRLIPIRNAVAHRRRQLTADEKDFVIEIDKWLVGWLVTLDGYSAPSE